MTSRTQVRMHGALQSMRSNTLAGVSNSFRAVYGLERTMPHWYLQWTGYLGKEMLCCLRNSGGILDHTSPAAPHNHSFTGTKATCSCTLFHVEHATRCRITCSNGRWFCAQPLPSLRCCPQPIIDVWSEELGMHSHETKQEHRGTGCKIPNFFVLCFAADTIRYILSLDKI